MSPAKGNIALNWESLFKTVRKKKKKNHTSEYGMYESLNQVAFAN